MSKRFLSLVAGIIVATTFTISCMDPHRDCDLLQITNNSEYAITWVVIIDAGDNIVDKSESVLIAKNGGTKNYGEYYGETTVCVKAEDHSEFMCTTYAPLCTAYNKDTINIVWNGADDPAWQPLK